MVTGQMEARTPQALAAQLREQRIMVTSVREKSESVRLKISGFGGKVKDKELTVFTRQIATMINAGLPLVQSLEVLASQQPNKQFKKVLTKIREDVEGGSTFAASIKRHPAVFTSLYMSMVEAGEAGGFLDTILNRLAGYIEKTMALRRKVKGALIYPVTIITVAIAIVIFLLIFVIPTFKTLFEGFGAALPLPTRIVLGLSRLVKTHVVTGLGAFVGAIFGRDRDLSVDLRDPDLQDPVRRVRRGATTANPHRPRSESPGQNACRDRSRRVRRHRLRTSVLLRD